MPIDSIPHHVAIAVPSIDAAAARWRDQLGGAWASPRMDESPDFRTQQLRFANHTRLELLEPARDDGFAAGFLDRFGARVHHVTLKVPDLLPAVRAIRDAGYDVVDVSTDGDLWHEAFLRPSQVGGIIAQVAWSGHSDEQWLARTGTTAEPLRDRAAELLGPTIFHPDLDACARVWEVLGGTVATTSTSIEVSWPDAPLTVRIEQGDPSRHPVLRTRGHAPVEDDPASGPATVTAP